MAIGLARRAPRTAAVCALSSRAEAPVAAASVTADAARNDLRPIVSRRGVTGSISFLWTARNNYTNSPAFAHMAASPGHVGRPVAARLGGEGRTTMWTYMLDPRRLLAAKVTDSLIAAGAAWRYLDTGADAGAAWVQPALTTRPGSPASPSSGTATATRRRASPSARRQPPIRHLLLPPLLPRHRDIAVRRAHARDSARRRRPSLSQRPRNRALQHANRRRHRPHPSPPPTPRSWPATIPR